MGVFAGSARQFAPPNFLPSPGALRSNTPFRVSHSGRSQSSYLERRKTSKPRTPEESRTLTLDDFGVYLVELARRARQRIGWKRIAAKTDPFSIRDALRIKRKRESEDRLQEPKVKCRGSYVTVILGHYVENKIMWR